MKSERHFLAVAQTVLATGVLGLFAGCTDARSDGPVSSVSKDTLPAITVTILGSGTPVPNRDQAGAAILVEAAGEAMLFDCGRGCSTRLAAYDPSLLTRIDKIFLTHLHSDHVVGLPDLWLNGWTQGQIAGVNVWGPAGTNEMFEGLRTAYAADISIRTAPGGPKPPGSLRADINRLPEEGGNIFESGALSVTAIPVRHAGMPAFGYRIDHAGRSVVISGDTTVTPALAKAGVGADLLLLEVASPAMVDYVRRTFAAPQADAIIGLHLTAPQAAAIMKDIQPELATVPIRLKGVESGDQVHSPVDLASATGDLIGGSMNTGLAAHRLMFTGSV